MIGTLPGVNGWRDVMAIDDHVRLDTRLAGEIRRYHTWPIIGQQTIGEHTWQLLRIYLTVTDKIDPHMVFHIEFHDVGEHTTGDLPYPVKHDNPLLHGMIDGLEIQSQLRQFEYWDGFKQTFLSDEDKRFFKQIELIEMAEFGMGQVCLGNSYGFIIADRCLKAAYERKPRPRLIEYIIKRLNIFFSQCVLVLNEEERDLEAWWNPAEWSMLNDSQRDADRRAALQDQV